jgi:hypothetical protein
MTQKPKNEPRRISPMILGGIVAVVVVAACLGLYLTVSNRVDSAGTRKVASTPKTLLAQDAATAAQLVGGKVCRECHPSESAVHSLSGHARTLRRAPGAAITSWLDGRSVTDREHPEAVWTFSVTDGGKVEVERNEHGQSACFPVDYVLGSGVNAMTFVSLGRVRADPAHLTGLEQRISYYTKGPRLDITPGQFQTGAASLGITVAPHGRPLDKDELATCLKCHATITSTEGPGRVDPATLVPNISCERCHGPGRAHVEAARRRDPEENLTLPLGSAVSAPPLKQLESCGECHRRVEDVPPWAPLVPENPDLLRFQPVGLSLSPCFQKGKSGLSCTSCHDPHARVSSDHAAYETVCLNCHGTVQQKQQPCPVSPSGRCIDCHMPRRPALLGFLFTDHWIRKPDRTQIK